MTEAEVLEALQGYANEHGFKMIEPESNLAKIMFPAETRQQLSIAEMKLPSETNRRLLVKLELTEAGSAWMTFRLLVGRILDPGACIRLFFTGTWPTSNFFFKGVAAGNNLFLVAEIFAFLHKDLSVKQAEDVMALVAQLPMRDFSWPDGLEIF